MSSSDHNSLFAIGLQEPSYKTLSLAKMMVLILSLLLLIAGSCRYLVNQSEAKNLQQRTKASLKRSVISVRPKTGEASHKLTLPASLRGNTETQLYARGNGYLKAWHKTIGDSVKKGELLAEIDIPELEQELAQARVAIDQIQVRLQLAHTTLKRWTQLKNSDSVIQQEYDEKRSAAFQAEADLAAAKVNLKRLEKLDAYRHITAPFAGVITRRSVDIGSLINVGSQELFALTQIDPLRLSVWIPQAYADEVATGQKVSVRILESHDKSYTANIDHIAGALDPVNRTRQVDITLTNPDGKLLPGAYVEVSIKVLNKANPLIVPANTLVVDNEGTHVVAIDGDKRINFRKVKLGHDFGREVEIVEGIHSTDILVASPSDLLVEGETVSIVENLGKDSAKSLNNKTIKS